MPEFEELRGRFTALEEAYEFFLAYAAQGLSSDSGSKSGGQLREFLASAAAAVESVSDDLLAMIDDGMLEPPDAWYALAEVVARDERAAGAAIRLVLSRPSVSSQLVDNLNANIHLRALLTDFFLIDELLG
jgi:hypothetical protein